jgi:hypothetical protein
MEDVSNLSIGQTILLIILVCERIVKIFTNSHCYKKFSISSPFGKFEIQTEDNENKENNKEEN